MTETTTDRPSDATLGAPTDRPTGGPTDRRTVLRAGGVCTLAAGGALLAACSGGGSDAATLPRSTGSAPGATGDSGIPTSSIPVGGGTFFTDRRLVVTQPTAGTFEAFDTTCPHQQNPVTVISGDVIVCTFHGSTFDLASGAHVAGPAPRGLTRRTVTVSGDRLVVS